MTTTAKRRKPTTTTARKRKAAPRRRATTTTTANSTTTRRRRRTTKKSFLSEAFDSNQAKSTASLLISGALGFYLARQFSALSPNMETQKKALLLGGGAFAVAQWLKMPGMAVGLAAGSINEFMNAQTQVKAAAQNMSEANFVSPQALAQLNEAYDELDELEALPMVIEVDGMSESMNIYNGIPFNEL